MSDRVRFENRRVGEIDVDASEIVRFESLPGFPGRSAFVVMEHAPGSPLAWLASLDDADLAFVVTSPFAFFPDYEPPIEREHLAALGIEKREEVELLAMVSLADGQIFVNLSAPLLVNAATRRGLQVLGEEGPYAARTPIPALEAPKESAAADAVGPASPVASPAPR